MNFSKFFSKLYSENSSRTFLIDSFTKNQLTYKEVLARSASIASQLRKLGLNPGDRLATSAPNSIEFAILYIGCILARICVVPINPDLTKIQSEQILSKASVQALFCDMKMIQKLNIHNESSIEIILGLSPSEGICSLDFETQIDPLPFIQKLNDQDTSCIVYTSGTTSDPKGVKHSTKSLFTNGKLFVDTLNINEARRFINYLPMTYLGGYYN